MLRALCLTAALLGLPSWAAAQAEAPQTSPSLTLPSPGCVREYEEHTNSPFDVCGYAAVAINTDATRILAISVAGEARLFDREGELLFAVDRSPSWPLVRRPAALFVNDYAVAIIDGQLIVVRAEDGQLAHRHLLREGSDYEYAGHNETNVFFRRFGGEALFAVDLVSGDTVSTRANARPLPYDSPQTWALGVTPFSRDRAEQPSVILANRDLTSIETVAECQPLSAPMHCVSFDYRTLSGNVVDLQTGVSTPFDLRPLVSSTTMVKWLSIDGHTIALVRTGFTEGGLVAHYSIIDVMDNRVILAFEGGTPSLAAAHNANGDLELRIGVAGQLHGNPTIVSRIDPQTGATSIIGTARNNTDIALVTPIGDAFIPDPADAARTLSIASDGRVRASLQFEPHRCNQYVLWRQLNICAFSADGSAMAVINENGSISLLDVPSLAGASP